MATTRVKKGDTLSGIAAANGVSLRDLLAANPQISNPNMIRAGQTVKIPTRAAAPSGPVRANVPTGGTSSTGNLAPTGGLAPTPIGDPVYDRDGNFIQMYSDGTSKIITASNRQAQDADASATVMAELAPYGLQNLGPLVMDLIQSGRFRSPDGKQSAVLIMQEIRKNPVYQNRFKGKLQRDAMIAEQVAKGQTPSLNSISEAEQIALENSYRRVASTRGLPLGFYDNVEDFTTLITNGYSSEDFDKAVTVAQEASMMAPPEVKAALRQRYNLGDQDLMALFLDPDKAKATLMGAGVGAATRALNVAAVEATGLAAGAQAEQLATEFAPGTEMLDTRQFTEQAAALAPLSKTDITGVKSSVTGEDVLRNVAGQTAAKGRIKREQERRLAEYEAGGSLSTTAGGVTGLRSTRTEM